MYWTFILLKLTRLLVRNNTGQHRPFLGAKLLTLDCRQEKKNNVMTEKFSQIWEQVLLTLNTSFIEHHFGKKKHSVEFSIATAVRSSFTVFVINKYAGCGEFDLSLNTVFPFSFNCDSSNHVPKALTGLVPMFLNNLAKVLLTCYINTLTICLPWTYHSASMAEHFLFVFMPCFPSKNLTFDVTWWFLREWDSGLWKVMKWAGAAPRYSHMTTPAQAAWESATSCTIRKATARDSDPINCHTKIC